ncbi:hypothetical protein GCM10027181_15740 [Rheinheimera gaetbuli]
MAFDYGTNTAADANGYYHYVAASASFTYAPALGKYGFQRHSVSSGGYIVIASTAARLTTLCNW